MASISGYTSSSYRNMTNMYKKMSSGKRINSAADDAAGLAVAKSMQLQAKGSSVRISNARDEQNAINIKDGAMSNATESLQRMGALAQQASNGTYSRSDLRAIQSEIDQLKQEIGSDQTDALGLSDFNVTSGDVDLSAIGSAVNSVSSTRGDYGAESNAIDRFASYSSVAEENLTAAQSQVEDLDPAEMISKLKTEQTLMQYRLTMQSQSMQRDRSAASQLFGSNGF